MLSMQCTVQCLKRNLRCSVSVHSSKNTRTQNMFKILVLFLKLVLNFANFLKSPKSRNLILAKISKNKV